MSAIVSVEDVSKRFHLYASPRQRLRDALSSSVKRSYREFWALRNVSFSLSKGRALGIIGRNGSGKSTLLQIVYGVLRPTSGGVVTQGRISALLELGAGFNPEYTGRSNVFMNLALLGYSRPEIEDRFGWIEDFAGIGEFIEQPVKVYSTGMFVRLAFACAVSVDPDILIIDEALAVGDVFFQQKCFSKIREFVSKGTTCLFVSHDTSAVENLCDEALLLRNGEVDYRGTPEQAVSRYSSSLEVPSEKKDRYTSDSPVPTKILLRPRDVQDYDILRPGGERHGRGGLTVRALRVTDCQGKDTLAVRRMEALSFFLLLEAGERVAEPSAGIHLHDRLGNLVFAAGTYEFDKRLPSMGTGDQIVVKMTVTFSVRPGEYTFKVGASSPWGNVRDRVGQLGPIVVQEGNTNFPPFYGVARLPMSVACSALYSQNKPELTHDRSS